MNLLAAVQRWIFRPARPNGKPVVATQVNGPVRFSLDC